MRLWDGTGPTNCHSRVRFTSSIFYPEYQGVGLGTRLFRAARRNLCDHGLKGLVVWALEENAGAVSFYEGAGGFDSAEGIEIFDQKALRKIAYTWA